MKKIILSVLASACLMGCAHRPKTVDIGFDPAEYEALPKTGTGIVQGQAFMRTKGGDVKKGAGETIILRPATFYARAIYSNVYLGGKYIKGGINPIALQYDRTTVADGEGRYEFTDVPPGEYYLYGRVIWSVFTPSSFGPIEHKQGGVIVKRFTVENGETTKIMLTEN